MFKVNLETSEKMTNFGAENEPKSSMSGNFALYGTAGTNSGSVVYFELEPGFELGNHTDSAEEKVYIISGTVKAYYREKSIIFQEVNLESYLSWNLTTFVV